MKKLEGGDQEFNVFFDDESLKIFSSFIEPTKKTLDILTYTLHSKAVDMLFSNLNPRVSVKIIVKKIGPRIYRKVIDMAKMRDIDIYVARCKDLHAKMCIQDDDFVLLGSSNLTVDSLGDHERIADIEANVATNYPDIVRPSRILFDAVLEQKTLSLEHHDQDEGFISSGFGFPTKIIDLVESAEREIVIVTPSNVEDEIAYLIRRLNEKVKLKVIVSWPNEAEKRDILGLEAIAYLAEKSHLTEITPISRRIHAKIFIFDWKTALISSANLTRSSWLSNIETGVLTRNKDVINQLRQKIHAFRPVVPTKIFEKKAKKEGGKYGKEVLLPIDEKRIAFRLERTSAILRLLKLRLGFLAFRGVVIRRMKNKSPNFLLINRVG